MKKILTLVSTVICILAAPQITHAVTSGISAQTAAGSKIVGTVTASSGLNFRKTAETTSAVLATIPKNTQVDVISKNASNWYNVMYNGQTGWVLGSYITIKTVAVTIPATGVSRSDSNESVDNSQNPPGISKVVGTVTASSSLNLRQAAGTTSAVLAAIPKNTQVDVISKNASNWYNVIYNGQTGWVSGSYLTVKTVAVTTPAAEVSRSGRDVLVDDALALVGAPYVFGGTS
ncbi:MAG: SH3 domain-containing protein, partial [Bacillota bacterium]|nr:SH3 domain-containing protein [Bacillota bacterium]